VFSGFSAGIILTAPMKGAINPSDMPQGSDLFSALPRILAAVGSSIPALVIFGGAIWSAWRVMRGATPSVSSTVQRTVTSASKLATGNALIALGAATLAASGTMSGRLGADTAFAISLMLGIAILFAGFLVASTATQSPTVKRSAELFR
jgi:dihydroxyacid dehydratase/phosphogluconate dehydratase